MDRMQDFAHRIISYSTAVKPGEYVLIESWDGADDLAAALQHEVLQAGGIPVQDRRSAVLQRQFLMEASEEQMEKCAGLELERMKKMDAYIAVRKADNCYENSDVPSGQMAMWNRISQPVRQQRSAHTKWCTLRYPNASMAQLCTMSTEAMQDRYFEACCLDYALMTRKIRSLTMLMHQTDRVHLLAPGTDLTFSIKGCIGEKTISCDYGSGRVNIPDGEEGGGIVKDSANGTIRYNVPSTYNGKSFTGISFRLENGKIVHAECDGGARRQAELNAILDTDEGARYIGEFALGLNPKICSPVGDILFDEKMWGTLHFTPGCPPTGIHWDLVLSQKEEDGGGEIWFDDRLIRKNGIFTVPELSGLNPEHILERED